MAYIILYGTARLRIGYVVLGYPRMLAIDKPNRITWNAFGRIRYSNIYVSSPKTIIFSSPNR